MHSCKEEYRIYKTSTTEAGYPDRAQTFSSATMIPSEYVRFRDPFHLLTLPCGTQTFSPPTRLRMPTSWRLFSPCNYPNSFRNCSHGGSVRFYAVLIHMASLLSCRATAISTTRTQDHLTVVRFDSRFIYFLSHGLSSVQLLQAREIARSPATSIDGIHHYMPRQLP